MDRVLGCLLVSAGNRQYRHLALSNQVFMCTLDYQIMYVSTSWPHIAPFLSRMNVSTGAARPNPQGSFHYGSINVSQVYKLRNEPPVIINGKKRTTLSGISYSPPDTPLRLADLYDKKDVYTLDFPTMPIDGPPVIRTSVINSTYKNFLEIVFQNNDTTVQTYHIDGYAFWVVG